VTTNGRPEPESAAPIASIASRSMSALAWYWEKSWM